ncbi:hypothetical protein TcCL_ESM00264 [Trypanosoma cruzi]|nr:hypothetical protein TcCL_ESM00264 [Trypanosoma cruzi]
MDYTRPFVVRLTQTCGVFFFWNWWWGDRMASDIWRSDVRLQADSLRALRFFAVEGVNDCALCPAPLPLLWGLCTLRVVAWNYTAWYQFLISETGCCALGYPSAAEEPK